MANPNIKTPEEFKDICPIPDEEFNQNMRALVEEPGLEMALKGILPAGMDFNMLKQQLLLIQSQDEFQFGIMKPLLELIEMKTTSGISFSGEECFTSQPNTYMSNHRDIVLDASFLNLVLVRCKRPTCEIAIGNNLLIYKWIDTLVRLNKSFVVKRDTTPRERLQAAMQLSRYINFTLTQKESSVWIAQRQGRAKDSNDRTQDSLIKMLTLADRKKSIIENLKALNIMPLSLSYEYDPNDYLKATEFLQKRRNPDFKKSQRDDLVSMETGLVKFKGHIHFAFTPCINDELDKISAETDKQDMLRQVCEIIDKQIHSNYHIFACNYIAYDLLHKANRFEAEYSAQDVDNFKAYLDKQLSRVEIEINDEEREFMLEQMLIMYANPLINKLVATSQE